MHLHTNELIVDSEWPGEYSILVDWKKHNGPDRGLSVTFLTGHVFLLRILDKRNWQIAYNSIIIVRLWWLSKIKKCILARFSIWIKNKDQNLQNLRIIFKNMSRALLFSWKINFGWAFWVDPNGGQNKGDKVRTVKPKWHATSCGVKWGIAQHLCQIVTFIHTRNLKAITHWPGH